MRTGFPASEKIRMLLRRLDAASGGVLAFLALAAAGLHWIQSPARAECSIRSCMRLKILWR